MNQIVNSSIKVDLLTTVLREQTQFFREKKLGVQREVLLKLKSAISSSYVVVITGLRRVGKSTLLAQIAQKYLKPNSYYFINFEDERLINFVAADFDLLYETLISLYGRKKIFLLDEIQNVQGWERFVRRLSDQGFKFILTGSNASLLSQELGTRLTGRYIAVELYPFSFKEFIKFKKPKFDFLKTFKHLSTKEKGLFLRLTKQYLKQGGIADALKFPDLPIHQTLYNDILYRDIASRYNIANVKSLKELALYLISNNSSLISFNKLKNLLKLGSVNTIKNYIDYLENSWLFFTINKFAASVKEQQIAPKKIYSIDFGMAQSIGFSFSDNFGKSMENLVFLQLKRQYSDEIFYYKTQKNHEVDFYIPKQGLMIQVCQNFSDEQTQRREIRSLIEASHERKHVKKLIIINYRDRMTLKQNNCKIKVVPLFEWLLS